MDYEKITNIEFDGVDETDYPKYDDAYILYAEYNGRDMTEAELEIINENRDFVLEKIHSQNFN